MGCFVKYAACFLMETQVIELFLRKLGEHPSAMFSDHLNSNRHKLSVKNKHCFTEMSNRNASASLQSGETKRQNNRVILNASLK